MTEPLIRPQNTTDADKAHRLPSWAVLAAIFALALALRLWGIQNGLPYSQLTDEGSDVATALRIVAGETPDHVFRRVGWPVSQLPVHGLHFLYLRASNPGFSFEDFRNHYFSNRGDFLLWARVWVAVLSSLSTIAAYALTRTLTSSTFGGIIASLLLAVHPAHVYIAHVALPDGFSLAWVVVALLASLHIAKSGARWAYLLAGVSIAAVMLARLQHSTIILPVGLAHILYWWQQPNRPIKVLLTRWLLTLAALIVMALLLNPLIVLHPVEAIADANQAFVKRFGPQTSLDRRLDHAILNLRLPIIMMRPYVALAALVGVGIVLLRRDWYALLVIVFGVAVALSLATLIRPKISYLLPTVIPAVLMIAYAVTIARQSRIRWITWGGGVLSLVIVGWSTAETLMIDGALGNANTKMAAYTWVTEHIPPDSNILSGEPYAYSVPLARTDASILRLGEQTRLTSDLEFQLDHPEQARLPQYNLYGPEHQSAFKDDESWWAFVQENGIEYVIEADYCGSQGYRYDSNSPIQFPVITDPVREDLILLEVFSPFSTDTCQHIIPERLHLRHMDLAGWQAVGPLIRIYQVPPPSTGNS